MSGGEFTFEEWRDIPNYEGYYQASDLGRVRSLDRWVTFSNGSKRFYKGRVIKGSINRSYRQTTLGKHGSCKTLTFAQLVALTFLGHNPKASMLVVDHIDGDKLNDKADNLRLVTSRDNISTSFRSDRASLTSMYVGVYWHKGRRKWQAQIKHNGCQVYLGGFKSEKTASRAYQSALLKVQDGSFNPSDYKYKSTSMYKGIYFNKRANKWQAQITVNNKRRSIGYFKSESEAYQAYLEVKKAGISNQNT